MLVPPSSPGVDSFHTRCQPVCRRVAILGVALVALLLRPSALLGVLLGSGLMGMAWFLSETV